MAQHALGIRLTPTTTVCMLLLIHQSRVTQRRRVTSEKHKLAPHHRKRRLCFLMICQYHAPFRPQTKARGHIYVHTTVTSIFYNPQGIQIIYKNFSCATRPEELLFSSEKHIFPEYFCLKFQQTHVPDASARTHQYRFDSGLVAV